MHNKKLITAIIFISFETLLFILINVPKFFVDISILEYLSIVLCLIFSLIVTKKFSYLNVGIIFTAIADLFLVILMHYCPSFTNAQLLGMVSFSIVQLSYFFYLYTLENKTIKLANVITRSIASIIALLVCLIAIKSKDPVVYISGFYFVNLVSNIIFAFIDFRKNTLFAIGLLLFACCDVYVGIQNAPDIFSISPGTVLYSIFYPNINMAWIFYLPSQVLIALHHYKCQRT